MAAMDVATSNPGPRGDRTREALLAAAIDTFGRDGFAAASTRRIAEAAGVNQALIGYHYGGKPGLYRAALQHIADTVRQRLGPLVEQIEAAIDTDRAEHGESVPPFAHLAALQQLTDAFVAVLTSDESAPWARLILREQQDPSESFDVLYSGIMSWLIGITSRLIGGIRDADPAASETRLTAMTLLGQALVFRTARAAALRQMGWVTIGPQEMSVIQAELRRNIAAMLAPEMHP